LFLLRRVLFVTFIIWFYNEPEVQWASYVYVSVLLSVYLFKAKPFETKWMNRLHLFNELMVLFIGIVLITMTGVMQPSRVKEVFGWVAIVAFIILAFVNIVNMLADRVL
jgi:hypothetical protein